MNTFILCQNPMLCQIFNPDIQQTLMQCPYSILAPTVLGLTSIDWSNSTFTNYYLLNWKIYKWISGADEYLYKENVPANKFYAGIPWHGYDYKCASFRADIKKVSQVTTNMTYSDQIF